MDTRIIHSALFTPGVNHHWGLPLILIGQPGTAKSALIVEKATEVGLHVEVVIASLRDPTDFLGMPVVTKAGGVEYIPPSWAKRAAAAGRAVVVLDEINTAPPAVQAALLRVVLDRCVGDFQLPDGVRFIAARNAVEDAAGGYDLPTALSNRFGHIDWQAPDVKLWAAHVLGSGNGNDITANTTAEAEESRVMKSWPVEFAKAAGVITSFLQRKPSLLHQQPAAGSPACSGAWPSRRTWDMAIRALASARVHGLDEDEGDRFVGSFVGPAANRELRTWMSSMDLPDPAELLDGKVQFKSDPDRLDRTMVVFSSCAALVAPTHAEKRDARAAALWSLLHSNMETSDVCYPAVCTLTSRDVRLVNRQDGNALKVLAKFHPILKAAGVA